MPLQMSSVFVLVLSYVIFSKSTATGDLRVVEVGVHILSTAISSLYWCVLNCSILSYSTTPFKGLL